MRIALAQNNYLIGDFGYNTQAILGSIKEAEELGAELVVFSELSVCGYPPADFLEFPDFVERCQNSVKEIARTCTGIAAIIGCPVRNNSGKGKPLYNAALFLCNGKIENEVYKTLLPNYDVFDEYRYFEPNRAFKLIQYKSLRIALTICEDLWNLSESPLYVDNPMEKLAVQNPDLIINIAASPYDYTQTLKRGEILSRNARNYSIPLIYVNQVGAQTELIFDGNSAMLDSQGNTVLQLPAFKEALAVIDTAILPTSLPNRIPASETPDVEEIYQALVLGIHDYFSKLGMKKAILGLSGGIDSAVVAVLAADAFGAENVTGLLMPSGFSSQHSIDDALALAKNIGCKHEIISIEEGFRQTLTTLSSFFAGLPSNLAEENIQARLRAVILMAFSNKFGYILLNTSNKSEAAVGYGTLYGDMCGGLSVLGDVYKTQVYDLARFINRDKERIPVNSILKAPSAELRPDQKDSDSLPDYEILDKILTEYIEKRTGPADIIRMGYEKPLVDRVLHLVNSNEYKRYQCPPVLRISPKAFGSGRRMPIAASYLSL